MPPFWKFFIRYIEQRTKTFCKNRLTGPVRNRSTGDDFEIYRSGRVEKILTDSISEVPNKKIFSTRFLSAFVRFFSIKK